MPAAGVASVPSTPSSNPPAPEQATAAQRETDLNLADKIRDDWKVIRRSAKSDVQRVLHTIREWVTGD
jgi:hypothetical protein